MLEINDVSKKFGDFTAVKSISLRVAKGETVGLLGVNGAGKTTLMNMILGLITPSSGEIRVFGEELAGNRVKILKRTNFCTTYAALPSNLKVWQNLKVFARLYGVDDVPGRIVEVLEQLEIGHLRNAVTGHLSAGESTRVNLAKALLNHPDLLLLDEPTASLDPDIADKVRKYVRQMQREMPRAILYTSHNMRDIEEVCDRIIFLHEGKILVEGTAEEIKTHFKESNLDEVFIKVARAPRGAVEN